MSRALRLRREPLAALTPYDLAAVVAAGPPPTIDECPLSGPYPTLPVNDCLTNTIVTSEVAR